MANRSSTSRFSRMACNATRTGVWRGRGTEPVSYPAAGNNACFALEDSSFWFAHRNACLLAVLRQFPAIGPFFDIGCGNGFVAAVLQSGGGVPVVLVEPGADGVSATRGRADCAMWCMRH
jgi:hypothetical protein